MAEHSETMSGPGAGAAPAGDTAALAGAIVGPTWALATARVQPAVGLGGERNYHSLQCPLPQRRPRRRRWTTRSWRELADELAYLSRLSAQKETVRARH